MFSFSLEDDSGEESFSGTAFGAVEAAWNFLGFKKIFLFSIIFLTVSS